MVDIYSGTVDDFRVQPDLPGEGQAVHDEGGCEPVEVPEEKVQQTRGDTSCRIMRSMSDWGKAMMQKVSLMVKLGNYMMSVWMRRAPRGWGVS